jgi:MazG family protein
MPESEALDPLRRLLDIMAILRAPEGCPWDAEQTTESLKPYLLEEAYEVLEAIDKGDPSSIRDELGDLLLQIVFHARIFEERGEFDFKDVASAIAKKLIRRHPHVFADATAGTLHELSAQWERIKAEERAEGHNAPSALDRIPSSLPALVRARKMAQKAAQAGLTGPELSTSFSRIGELLKALETASEKRDLGGFESRMGEILFALADIGRPMNVDAEDALRKATENFRRSLCSGSGAGEDEGEK